MKVELVCEEVKGGITCGGGPDSPNTTHLAVKLSVTLSICKPLLKYKAKYPVLSKVSMFKIQTHSFHIRGHDEVE